MNSEGLIQQNSKMHIFIEREKIRKRYKEFMKEIWKLRVNPIWPGLFWSITSRGDESSPLSKIWSAWARVMKHGMHTAWPISNSITYFLEPRPCWKFDDVRVVLLRYWKIVFFQDIFNFIVILFKMHEKFRESNQIVQWINKRNCSF